MRIITLLALVMLPWICSGSVEPYSLKNVGREEISKHLPKRQIPPKLFDRADGCFRSNDMETVKEWVHGEGDVNSQNTYGTTLLKYCVMYENPKFAQWLVDNGADVDLQSGKYGYSPLIYAINKGSVEIVRLLVDAGANLDLRGPDKRTALHHAALEHQADAVEMLLKAGADPLLCGKFGTTPLHNVSFKFRYFERGEITGDFKRTTKLLIDAGVNINAPLHNGKTALYNAVDNEAPEVARLLLDAGADANIVPPDKPDALHLATTKGSLEMVTALVEAGAEIDAVGEHGITAMYRAAADKHFGIVDYLVGAGADPTILVKSGMSVLHRVAGSKETELCRKLIAAGAVPDLVAQDGSTPLLYAAAGMYGTNEQQTYDTLRLLLAYDDNLNVAFSNGMYPIHYTASAGYIECAKLLLLHGASIDVRTESGLLPMHLAARGQHKDLVSLLTNDSVQPDIFVAYRLDDKALFKKLVAQGADINQGFYEGHSILTMAAWHGKEDWLDMLLAMGADVNHAGNNGSTALMKACVNRYTGIAEELLEHGADPDQRTFNNMSALHVAAKNNLTEVVRMLLEAGASPNVQIAWGDTPLHWAAKNNDVDSAKELIIGGADLNVQNDKGETPFFLACKGYTTDLTTACLLLRWSANPCISNNDGDLPKQNHSPRKTYAEKLADQPPPTYSPSWFDWHTKIHPEYNMPIEDQVPIHTETPEERMKRVKEAIGWCK